MTVRLRTERPDAAGIDAWESLTSKLPFSDALAQFELWRATGGLCRVIEADGQVVARALPLGQDFAVEDAAPRQGVTCRLSRFACLRRVDERLVLESPLAHAQIEIASGALAATLPLLAAGIDEESLARQLGCRELATAWLALCRAADMLEDGEETADGLRHWAFHDLLFHCRSRAGRHREPYGGLGAAVAEPEATPSRAGLPLWRPQDVAAAPGPSLDAVLAARRSRPHHGAEPITARELGEFLWRSVRGEDRRPYPAAGGIYAVEVMVAVDRCRALEPGLYRYRVAPHELEPVAAAGDELRRLMTAAGAAARAGLPQTLVVLTARFARLSIRYGSIAYALLLKEAGALMQTMYLAGTAMDLAVCAVGGGDADVFAQASGLSYTAEGPVGELLLGRAAAASGILGLRPTAPVESDARLSGHCLD